MHQITKFLEDSSHKHISSDGDITKDSKNFGEKKTGIQLFFL